MPEDQNIIFSLQLDDSGYITGVNNATAGTQRFAQAQKQALDILKSSQAALQQSTTYLAQRKQELDNYTGSNAVYQKQLQDDFEKASAEQQALTELVAKNQKSYDDATKAADEFLATAQKAQEVVNNQPTPGGQLDLFNQLPPPPVGSQLDLFNVPQTQDFAVLQQLVEQLKNTDLSNITGSVEEVTDAFKNMSDAIQVADEHLATLDKNSDEFKQLSPIVQQAKEVLEQYGRQLQETGAKHTSLRQQILNLNNDLARLEETGKGNTQQYIDMEKEVAHLTRLYEEQRARVRVLASETRALDFGKAAIKTAISFEALASVSVLAGGKQEELEKKTLQLFAAMQLLNGLEELVEQTKRRSVIATNLQSASQAIYTSVVGASTGALKAFKLALLGTGIGAALVVIGLLVKKFIDLKKAQEEANAQSRILHDINEKAVDAYAEQVSALEILKRELTEGNASQEKRIELAKEYNNTADQTNKIDLSQIDNTKLLTTAIDGQIDAIKKRAIATASANVAAEAANKLFKAQIDLERRGVTPELLKEAEKDIEPLRGRLRTLVTRNGNDINAAVKELIQENQTTLTKFTKEQVQGLITSLVTGDIKTFQAAEAEFNKVAKIAAGLQTTTLPQAPPLGSVEETTKELKKQIDDLTHVINFETNQFDTKLLNDRRKQLTKLEDELDTLEGKTKKPLAVTENIFVQERDKLINDLTTLRAKETNDIQKINDQFVSRLAVEQNRIEKLVKSKQVTKKEGVVLLDLAVQINEAQKQKAVDDAQKAIADVRKKIQDSVTQIEVKAQIDTASLLTDDFQRRATVIDINEQKELDSNERTIEEKLQQIKDYKAVGLITEEDYENAKNRITLAGEQEANNIVLSAAQERQQLSVDVFKQTLQTFENTTKQVTSTIDQQAATTIRTLSDQVILGTLPLKQFQQQVDQIKKDSENRSRQTDLENKRAELFALDHHLAGLRDRTSKGYQELLQKRQDLSDALSKLEEADAEADANNTKVDTTVDKVQGYAEAIGNLTSSVIGFWQAANDAEQVALDRSIRLQERRVDEAQRLADRGNATYLKSETDRLKQLEVERENSARRQLGIDAALQASQLLVGVTGAIAKIASGAGAVETIAEIGVIVAALATGYGLVKQLQANQPRLREGTPYVSRGTNPAGVDTIPAWLDEGEAVLPASTNRRYKPTVEAIYHEHVPAQVLNKFIVDYKNKDVTKMDEKSRMIYTIVNVARKFIGQEHDEKFIQTVKANDLKKYTEVVNSAVNNHIEEHSLTTSQIPSELNNIVYKAINGTKNTTVKTDNRKMFLNSLHNAVNEFVSNYTNVKHVPIPNYENISTVNEMKLGQDGKLHTMIEEQNSLIKTNNEHQKETQRILKAMGVNVKIDRDGVSAMVMKAIEQKKIYSKT